MSWLMTLTLSGIALLPLNAQESPATPVPPNSSAPNAEVESILPRAAEGDHAGMLSTSIGGPLPSSLVVTAPTYVTEGRPRQFRFAISAGSGYDTAVDDLQSHPGGLSLGEAYISILKRTRSFDLLLQHDATVSKSIGTGNGLQQFQATSALFTGEYSRATNWSLQLENGFGTDSVRSLQNTGGSVLPFSQTPDQDTVAYGLDPGETLSDYARLQVEHRLSAVRTLNISADSHFHHSFSNQVSDQQYSLNGLLQQRVSPRQSFGVELGAVQQSYAGIRCTTATLALHTLTQISPRTQIEGSAGPSIGSGPCGASYHYAALASATMPRGSTLYVGTSRRPSDGLVLRTLWETSSFGGMAVGQPLKLLLKVDTGYATYTKSAPTLADPNLHGFFVAGELRHRHASMSELSFIVRQYVRGPSPADLNRSIFLMTYTWSHQDRPGSGHLFGAIHEDR